MDVPIKLASTTLPIGVGRLALAFMDGFLRGSLLQRLRLARGFLPLAAWGPAAPGGRWRKKPSRPSCPRLQVLLLPVDAESLKHCPGGVTLGQRAVRECPAGAAGDRV